MLPPPARSIAGMRVLAAEEDTLQVHAHDEVPRLLVGLEDRAVGGGEDAGVAEEHVQLAPALLGGRDHRLRVPRDRDVRVDEDGLTSGALDLAHDRLARPRR